MLSRTTISGTQALLYLALAGEEEPIAPARIGERLGLSPSYMSKIARSFVRANILRAWRGAKGGVTLARPPARITLLEIVEAAQGQLFREADLDGEPTSKLCAFHRSMQELQRAVRATLQGWTLADLAERPCPTMVAAKNVRCLMTGPQGG